MRSVDRVVLAYLLSLAALLGWLEEWPEWGTGQPQPVEETSGSPARAGGSVLHPAYAPSPSGLPAPAPAATIPVTPHAVKSLP